jgi:hypothetical protein
MIGALPLPIAILGTGGILLTLLGLIGWLHERWHRNRRRCAHCGFTIDWGCSCGPAEANAESLRT